MQIKKNKAESKLTLSPIGRLDTVTSSEFESEIKNSLDDSINELVLDLAELDYVSSAGLRVILATHKTMSQKGGMSLKNVNEGVMEIFNMTGFSGILDIKE